MGKIDANVAPHGWQIAVMRGRIKKRRIANYGRKAGGRLLNRTWFTLPGKPTTSDWLCGISLGLVGVYVVTFLPLMYARAGVPFDSAYAMTLLVSAVATCLAGVTTKQPLLLVPGISINSYVAYTLIVSQGMPWQEACGALFLASLVLLLLWKTGVIRNLLQAIPREISAAAVAGIGVYILLIAMMEGHILAPSPQTLITFGDFADPMAYMSACGFLLLILCKIRPIRGAYCMSILSISLWAWCEGFLELPPAPCYLPFHCFALFGEIRFPDLYVWGGAAVSLVLQLLLLCIAIAHGMCYEKSETSVQILPAITAGNALGALFGAGVITPSPLSAVGFSTKTRTHWVPVVASGVLFFGIFLAPLARAVAEFPAPVIPVLMMSGFSLLPSLRFLRSETLSVSIPAWLTFLLIPCTGDIALGFGIGLVLCVFLQRIDGKVNPVSPSISKEKQS